MISYVAGSFPECFHASVGVWNVPVALSVEFYYICKLVTS